MEPLLSTVLRDLAHGAPASALPDAPVVQDATPRLVVARRRLGAVLRDLARRVEPIDVPLSEGARCRTA